MYSLGIDIGYSSVKVSLVNNGNEIVYNRYTLHKGKIADTLKNSIADLCTTYNQDDILYGSVTGCGGRLLTKAGVIMFANEVAAIVEGSITMNNDIESIIEIGGQGAKYITYFNEGDKSRIKISMNSNCSAGTGSFLEEQLSRLNLKLEDYSHYVRRAKSVPRIAGRCSVFAKTDITHHQQEGVAVEDILLGLAYAVIRNYKGAVMKKFPLKKPILFVGGVAQNQGIIIALKDVLKLDEGELVIPEYFGNVGAIGAAIIAKNGNMRINFRELSGYLETEKTFLVDNYVDNELPTLAMFGNNDSLDKHSIKYRCTNSERIDCFLGVDIGSTSTNLVLIDKNNDIISYKYLRTLGNPIEAIKTGFSELKKEFGKRLNFIGAGTTGSGRYMIGRLIGADVIKDEITSQARAAVEIDSSVDTIFEIGGQDSKYISLKDGIVTDFQMNKVCAAGTGSFIEEQVKKFNIPINDFGKIALSSQNPVSLGERCTVFIESSIAMHLSRGARLNDLVAGLCYSIIKNYLNRVVGPKKIGDKIFLQGGIAHNQGVVNAFRALTGKEIFVPPFFSVTGAYGVAILAKEEMQGKKTGFKGFEFEHEGQVENRKIVDPAQEYTDNFNDAVEKLVFEGYDGSIDDTKETVGIPRALFTYGMFSMFHAFFKDLGYNVLMSDPTNEETIRLGREYSMDEACYPVKLINGHVAELVQKKVDYIFFPDLYTVDHPGSKSRKNYGCAYMQLAFKVINQAMDLKNKGIKLLAPTIAFSLGKEFMMKSFAGLGKQLGKNSEQTNKALQKGMMAFHRFEERIEEYGKQVLQQLNPDKKIFVIISKIYGIADPVLNLGIPGKMMSMGYQVVPFYYLPEGDVSKEHPNMYWPFVQHILEPAYLVKQHPNLYAILLTHHCCGPDSVVTHYFKEIMDGKPYLNIEVDEHSSEVGVITRIEAFVNSLEKLPVKKAKDLDAYSKMIVHKKTNITDTPGELKDLTTLYLPYMYPYSEIFKEILLIKGINARCLPEPNNASIETGRKYILTNEYLSLAALLGDVFKELHRINRNENGITFLIPQTEGAEVDGQYNRLLRTKLDEQGFKNIDIFAPFLEDVLFYDENVVRLIFTGLLAGDIIRNAPKKIRNKHFAKVVELIRNGCLEIDWLKKLAADIYKDLKANQNSKKIFAIGESMILYNNFLNDFTFSDIEDKGYRIIYGSFSEAMWLFWMDYLNQNKIENSKLLQRRLDEFKNAIKAVAECFFDESPFEKDINDLVTIADETVGYYSGAFGRYREAKILSDMYNVDAIITATSTYENTGISLNILHSGFKNGNLKPVLNLTFDGNKNENDMIKIESFLHYLDA